MKSFTKLKTLFKTLSLNTSTANDTLAGILINDQVRYLYLKYFDNERTVTMLTIGPQTLTLTGTLAIGATSATLSSAWTKISCQQLVVFSSGEQRTVFFVQGSATITWQSALSAVTTTSISALGVQSYPLPANVSKIRNGTITVGQLVYSPAPVNSIQEWTALNALPYSSSIPAYFFIYNRQINFWPIPSASNQIITLNCQITVPDMTYEDNTTGTFATTGMVVGSNAVVGNGTAFNVLPTTTDLTAANLFITATPPNGDGLAYQIQSVTDATHLTLIKPVISAPNINGGSLLIGQYPLLDENFHDAIVYGALRVYYSSIVKDADKYTLYNSMFNERLKLMEYYLATKSVNVDLSATPIQKNPNLYFSAQ